jgi:molybdate transport system ATP-binding protein
VHRPDVLLLDEALNGLDARARRAFLASLRRAAAGGMTWVMSTHRAVDLPAGVTHVARLEHGTLTCADLKTQSRGRRRMAVRGRRELAAERRGLETRPPGALLLALRHVAVYREGRRVLGHLDWTVHEGEHWCVTGPNGAGKSTLVALLYGDLSPALGGRIAREGFEAGTPIEEWKRRAGLVSPELQAAYAATACTVEEIVASGLHSSIGLNEPPTPAELALVRASIARVGLTGLGRRKARELSYGQLRLALLARALIVPRRLLLLDEPYDGLDARSRSIADREIGRAVAGGAQVIVATHHAEDVPAFVDRRLELLDGAGRVRRMG